MVTRPRKESFYRGYRVREKKMAKGRNKRGRKAENVMQARGGGVESYQDFVARRQPELRAQGLSQGEAMERLGAEWKVEKIRRANQTECEMRTSVTKKSKLKGGHAVGAMRLEVPYNVEASPDLAAAWDVAEGVLDFLRSNASEQPDAFRQRAIAAHARAKGLEPEEDQTEYDLGQSIGEALLLVMAYRQLDLGDWMNMAPPQLGETIEPEESEKKGLLGSGWEILGIEAENFARGSKQVLMDKSRQKIEESFWDLFK